MNHGNVNRHGAKGVKCTSSNDTTVRGTRLRLGAKHSDGGSAHEISSSAALGTAREYSTPKHVAALSCSPPLLCQFGRYMSHSPLLLLLLVRSVVALYCHYLVCSDFLYFNRMGMSTIVSTED